MNPRSLWLWHESQSNSDTVKENVEADRFKAQVERLLQPDGRGKEGRGRGSQQLCQMEKY